MLWKMNSLNNNALKVSCISDSVDNFVIPIISITCLRNVYPIIPHFYKYIVKLGYTRVYLIVLFVLQNIDCGYWLEHSRVLAF